MSPNNGDQSKRDQRLDELVTAYLRDVEMGHTPNQAEWLARHPDLADDLAAFFAAQERVDQLAAPLRVNRPVAAADAPTTGLADAGVAPAAGTRLQYFGDYELLQEIGRGGMGVVYKARQVSLNRVVALKMILTGQLANEDDVKRFHAEAKAAANLQHDGIVPVFEVGKYEGHHYFTMAFVEGESLAHKLTEGMLPPRQAAELVKKIAKAVSYAHTEGVIHRDLKPANILLDKNGEPRLTDFGLAKQVSSGVVSGESSAALHATHHSQLTRTGQILGTPSYMPPEQASGKKGGVGPLADVYSLGAILYCLLTARPPFQADNPFDTLMQVVEHEPAAPRSLNAKVPRDLETICLKCLQKEPGKRYAAASALAEDLDRYLNGQPIVARPVGAWERTMKWAKRRPAAAALVGVSVTAAAALLIGGLIFNAELGLALADVAKKQTDLDQANINANSINTKLQAALGDVAVKQKDVEQANTKATASLTRADGLRLIYESETARQHNPALALLLAIEGAQRVPGNLANNAMQAAMDECRELRMFSGHGKTLFAASLNADGSKALTCGKDGTVRIWDAVTGRQLHVLNEPHVARAWFSPDGRRVLTLSLDGYVHNGGILPIIVVWSNEWKIKGPAARLWDTATGKSIAQWQPPFSIKLINALDAAFSVDSRRMVTSFGLHGEGACEVRDVETGAPVAVLNGPHSPVLGVAFSSDKRTVATVSTDKTACLWEAETGKLLHTLKGHQGAVGTAVFNADGKRLLTLALDSLTAPDDSAGRVWDTQTGKLVIALKWPNYGRHAFQTGAFTDDEHILLADTLGSARVWKTATGEPVPNKDRATRVEIASSVHISPLYQNFVLYAGNDRTARLAAGAHQVVLRGHDDDVLDAAFSANGKRIITVSKDGTARLWQAAHPRVASVAALDILNMSSDALSPDGRRLLVIQDDPPGSLLLDTGSRQTVARIDSVLPKVAYTPDGHKVLVVARTGYDEHSPWKAQLLDAGAGKVLATMNDLQGRFLMLSPDGRFVVLASWNPKMEYAEDGTATVWELATGKKVAELKGLTKRIHEASFSHDGRRILLLAGGEPVARIWDAASGKQLWSHGNAFQFPQWLSFFGDGRQMLAKIVDPFRERVVVLDANTGKEKLTLTAATVARGSTDYGKFHNRQFDATFSPDGRRVLILHYPDVPCIWDVDKGGEPALVLRGHADEVLCARFSGDDRFVVTGSKDRTARLWDAKTGKERMVFKVPEGSIFRAALDPAGKRLVTHSSDKTIRLWDVDSGQELARLRGQEEANPVSPDLAFTADGQQVVIATASSPRLWSVDILSAARERKPRELTAEERKRFDVGGR